MTEQEAITKLNECIEFFKWFNSELDKLWEDESAPKN